jgi:hypothetical protein
MMMVTLAVDHVILHNISLYNDIHDQEHEGFGIDGDLLYFDDQYFGKERSKRNIAVRLVKQFLISLKSVMFISITWTNVCHREHIC